MVRFRFRFRLPAINCRDTNFTTFRYRRMDQAAPAHQTLYLSVTTRQGSRQFSTWRSGWSRSPSGQGFLLLMGRVLRRIGQNGGRYNPSSVKRRKRERERERERATGCQNAIHYQYVHFQQSKPTDRHTHERPTTQMSPGSV